MAGHASALDDGDASAGMGAILVNNGGACGRCTEDTGSTLSANGGGGATELPGSMASGFRWLSCCGGGGGPGGGGRTEPPHDCAALATDTHSPKMGAHALVLMGAGGWATILDVDGDVDEGSNMVTLSSASGGQGGGGGFRCGARTSPT